MLCQGGDEQHNLVKGGQIHSKEAEVINLVGEHLQTKRKRKEKKGRGRVRAYSRREMILFIKYLL